MKVKVMVTDTVDWCDPGDPTYRTDIHIERVPSTSEEAQ